MYVFTNAFLKNIHRCDGVMQTCTRLVHSTSSDLKGEDGVGQVLIVNPDGSGSSLGQRSALCHHSTNHLADTWHLLLNETVRRRLGQEMEEDAHSTKIVDFKCTLLYCIQFITHSVWLFDVLENHNFYLGIFDRHKKYYWHCFLVFF